MTQHFNVIDSERIVKIEGAELVERLIAEMVPDDMVFTPSAPLTSGSLALGTGLRNLGGTGGIEAEGNTAVGIGAGDDLVDGWGNTLLGWHAGWQLSNKATVNTYGAPLGNVGCTFVGYNCGPVANGALDVTLVGASCGLNCTTAMDTVGMGIKCLESMEAASETVAIGHGALQYVVGSGSIADIDNTSTTVGVNYSWGHRITAVGDQAGRFLANGSTHKTRGKKSLYVGAATRSGSNFAINENAIGYAAIGLGSNTFVHGNSAIEQQRLPGRVCVGNGALDIPPQAPLHAYNSSSAGIESDGIRVSRPGASTAYGIVAFDTGNTLKIRAVYPTTKAKVDIDVSDGSTHLTAISIKEDARVELTASLKLASFTVATVPSASTAGAGAQIYVSNESGGGVIAFSDATNWRRVTDRAVIS